MDKILSPFPRQRRLRVSLPTQGHRRKRAMKPFPGPAPGRADERTPRDVGRARVLRVPSPRWLVGGWVLLLGAAGCSDGKRVEPPDFSPEEAAKQAMAAYDKNGDGALDATELEQCPPLKS